MCGFVSFSIILFLVFTFALVSADAPDALEQENTVKAGGFLFSVRDGKAPTVKRHSKGARSRKGDTIKGVDSDVKQDAASVDEQSSTDGSTTSPQSNEEEEKVKETLEL